MKSHRHYGSKLKDHYLIILKECPCKFKIELRIVYIGKIHILIHVDLSMDKDIDFNYCLLYEKICMILNRIHN